MERTGEPQQKFGSVAYSGGTHENASRAFGIFVTPSCEVMRELSTFSGNSPYIFPSPGKDGYMSSNTMLYALYRMGYHGRATTHGFRAVASTILNESNLFNRDWIERQLAHVERNEVRRAYNAAEWMPDR